MESYSKMHYPSNDMLSDLSEENIPNADVAAVEPGNPVSMVMRSMAKLNGSSSVTSLDSMMSSPRGSPRASQDNLFNMKDALFGSFEDKIAMNTGSKSVVDLAAMTELDNKMMHTENENLAIEAVRRFILAVERFLDFDGEGNDSSFLIC